MLEFISEIGINHNGKMLIAKKLIEQSKIIGATYVKFQIRNLKEMYNSDFLKKTSNSEAANQYIYNQLKKSSLSINQYKILFKYSKDIGLKVMLTPFDEKSLILCRDKNVNAIKVGSPDFENIQFIKKILKLKRPVYLSTGMTTLDNIKKVTSFIKKNNPHRVKTSFLHCVSSYPPREDEINLKFMKTLKKIAKKNDIGYSGHERGIGPSLLSIFFGSKIIERHITLNKTMEGPDHNSSITSKEFKKLINLSNKCVLFIEKDKSNLNTFINKFKLHKHKSAIGVDQKLISNNALFNKKILGKSFIYKKSLKRGSIIKVKNLKLVCPGKGLGPLEIDKFLNKKLTIDVFKNSYLDPQDFKKKNKVSYKINRNWGLVGRLGDFEQYMHEKADLIEIHLTWRELVNPKIPKNIYNKELIVHAPEYFNDQLIDFSSNNKSVLNNSFEMMENTAYLIDKLKNHFLFDEKKGPKLILHPGGHSEKSQDFISKNERYKNLAKNIFKLKSNKYNLLLENMPPYPWYFGGRYYQHIFTNTDEIYNFSNELDINVCYDTSHAKLASNEQNKDFFNFSKNILKITDHLHISDAKGTDGEGLQIGDGDINFKEFFRLAKNNNASFIPEIWNGHLNNGYGFNVALNHLEKIIKKISTHHHCTNHNH
ncbi:N-acetylneuraminate synthase family protein [Candidatus Pelagibacter ubique]|nr:N-acetylneuraminate synthase family protein [Candidatus Pelagibacter ubique]